MRRHNLPCKRKKKTICDSNMATSQVASSHSTTLTLAFWEYKYRLRRVVEKALAEDVRRAWRLTYKTVAVVAAVRVPLYSGMPIVSLLSRGGWIYRNLLCDDLLAGGGLLSDDAPLSDGGDEWVLGNVRVLLLRDKLSGVSACKCRIV